MKQLTLVPALPKTELNIPHVIQRALSVGATLAVSISGGKDSQAIANKLAAYWQKNGLTNPIFALHMDLGRAEWKETPAHVDLIADQNELWLAVVRRPQGDLVQEIEDRMHKLAGTGAPFWPSSASRYCTADQKRAQADKVYRDVNETFPASWPYSTHTHNLIISAEGNRAEESPKRRKDPVASVRKQITAKPLRDLPVDEALATWLAVTALLDAGDETAVREQFPEFTYYIGKQRPRLALTWYPIHDWLLEDVWRACGTSGFDVGQRREVYRFALELEESGADSNIVDALNWLAVKQFPAHVAYVYGNERLSCALCVLASDNDIRNGARHQPDLAAHFIHLEEVGESTFKNGRSLAEIIDGGKP